ncbi:DNA mismatch repair endonuclease MutL [Paenibacillus sp. JCM 10914]|uniref:DNA mismatch repair endonuclease MutL n=1 Tax=Paenibacillus sp. JCM 10914 TaxID=1236974 RepID=UPI0003CCAD5B|nr:DNA mismatch repair endonuclease MutL [Paenibacillus sp. JCM 10914]GAE05333.1 DNA mismatch repair protein MutL [Paenibacillus sp. JCM 10914]
MGKIRILDEHIANQIAAGEVVERPASVVKELVENAIDAGSTKIDVTIDEGGLDSIRVTDNGAGIDPEDCETAFYRHATSKITEGRDLFQITSLGFRGEALPSIAAVAKVRLVTSNAADGRGKLLEIEGGNLRKNEDTAAPRGTDFLVRELFFNTPARLKYMKTIQTELGHISDYMYRLALSRPNIAFTLRHNGNSLLQTLGNGDALQVIAAIYGTQSAKAMLPLEAENMDYTLSGFVSKPDYTRANRNAMSLIVNGRYIRNYGLMQAILRGYHTLLPINRFPLVVLQLSMHPSLIDVNVHPSKLEVRFSKEQELFAFIEEEVRRLLQQQVLIPQPAKQSLGKNGNAFIQEQLQFSASRMDEETNPDSKQPSVHDHSHHGRDDGARIPLPEPSAWNEQAAGSTTSGAVMPSRTYEGAAERFSSPIPMRETAAGADYRSDKRFEGRSSIRNPEVTQGWLEAVSGPAAQIPPFPELTLIGQHHGTYLIAQNDTGLYLIDQHAAHERINYEYYYEQFGNPADASQELLLPITLEFTPAEAEKVKDRLHWFEKVGVYMEHFGGQTFLVRSHPFWFPKGDEQELIEEMAEWVLSERSIDIAKLRETSSIMCSCKASIKANQKLTDQEAMTLISRLAACRQPYTCPHGRPIVISFSAYDLEKMFKRVM